MQLKFEFSLEDELDNSLMIYQLEPSDYMRRITAEIYLDLWQKKEEEPELETVMKMVKSYLKEIQKEYKKVHAAGLSICNRTSN